MEAVMTNEATQLSTLQSWWETAEFNGKEFCDLKENGDLVLKKTSLHPERIIARLVPENADAVVKALVEKFPEVEQHGKEIQVEWDAAEDKLKLLGKVSRHKDYLLHTNAIGDFDALINQVKGWESTITEISEKNYQEKLALIEKAEKLSAEGNSWKETTQALKEIADQWKNIGFAEKHKNDELWNRLEEARNKFFERKRNHQEEQEKEMLRNLDVKMELVEKAEGLAESENWKEATDTFRQLMDLWKATGRTMHDKNEELWNRFIQAKNNFYERKRVHFEQIQNEQEANYHVKLALVEKAEALKDSQEWSKTAQAYSELMEEWKNAGRVPLDKADELWNRFIGAKEHFFQNKRQHQETVKVSQEDNYARKLSLLKRAEELKHSNQWRESTEEMNELMTEWKKIGPVPREFVNSLWEQFISARKFFFERKDADRERRKEQVEKQFQHKYNKSRTFLTQLETELKEEQERLADFEIALANVTPGNKEEELKAHLNKLIAQCQQKIKHKEEKIADIAKQVEDIEKKKTKPEEKKEEIPPSPPETGEPAGNTEES
jgi:hypothetical protein